MELRKSIGTATLLLLALFANAAEKQDAVRAARAAYYNASEKGLASFSCEVIPDWEIILKGQNVTDPEKLQKSLETLRQLHFKVVVGPSGATEFNHSITNTDNPNLNAAYQQIYSGMSQAVTGFFQTWSGFVFVAPLPQPNSDYEFLEVPTGYVVRYVEGSSKVETVLAKDYTVSELQVKTAQFSAAVNPKFQHLSSGLLMSSYNSKYESTIDNQLVNLDAVIEYQLVGGYQIFQSLDFVGGLNSTHFHMKLKF